MRQGSRLSQIRFRRGSPITSASALRRLHEQFHLVNDDNANIRGDSIAVTLDLKGEDRGGLVGWKAKKHAELVDVDARAAYDPLDFWDPIALRPGRGLVLDPADFYVLATREAEAMIANSPSLPISAKTVGRRCKEVELINGYARKKPYLKPKHKGDMLCGL